jgi:hypothetical protein
LRQIEFPASRPTEISASPKSKVIPLSEPLMAMRWGVMAAEGYQKRHSVSVISDKAADERRQPNQAGGLVSACSLARVTGEAGEWWLKGFGIGIAIQLNKRSDPEVENGLQLRRVKYERNMQQGITRKDRRDLFAWPIDHLG